MIFLSSTEGINLLIPKVDCLLSYDVTKNTKGNVALAMPQFLETSKINVAANIIQFALPTLPTSLSGYLLKVKLLLIKS